MWFVAETYAGRLWVIAGFDNAYSANFGDVCYTKDGREWRQFESPTVFSPRHQPTTYVYKGCLWVVASNSWPLMNDVWQLALERAEVEGP